MWICVLGTVYSADAVNDEYVAHDVVIAEFSDSDTFARVDVQAIELDVAGRRFWLPLEKFNAMCIDPHLEHRGVKNGSEWTLRVVSAVTDDVRDLIYLPF